MDIAIWKDCGEYVAAREFVAVCQCIVAVCEYVVAVCGYSCGSLWI